MKKDGWQNGKQRYKCKACGKRFDGGKRLQNDELWAAYSAGKQTAAQLATQYGCSSKTIYRYLHKAHTTRCPKKPTSSWIP
ncbi:helix-turn-helix domain-containing protein, partial [Cardiobacterium hominis]|uniref:helix-turn-helix domain-containing protein n=1 Tax=Cardiobacterium hominis TaxID=2718 RepID=UPI0012DBE65C